MMQRAVRNVGVFPWLRRVAGHCEHVGGTDQIEGHVRVGGIKTLVAVCFKVVGVDLRRERRGGDGPEAGRVFFHGDGFGDAVESKRDFRGCSILVGEGDAAVGVDVGGAEMRGSLSGERKRCGKCKEQGEFASNTGREEIHMRQFSREAPVARG
jgi:hypothetical protein